MGRFGMTTEFDRLVCRQHEDVLEVLANALKSLLALFAIGAFLLATLGWLTGRPGPQTNTPESLADIDHDTHDFVVVLIFQHLTDSAKHDVEPYFVAGLGVPESVVPAAARLVL